MANRRLTAPLPMGNVIAVGDLEGYLHFLTRDGGKFAARIKLDSNPVMSLIAGSKSNQLIAETRDGGLYAVSVAENNSQPASAPSAKTRPEPTPAATEIEDKIDAIINEKLPLSTDTTETAPSSTSEPSSVPNSEANERSILFQKNDSMLLPDVETAPTPNTENSAPGIRLPNPEQQ